MKNYLLRHLQVFFSTLGQLARSPFSTLMTIAVIGITLALPATLYVVVNNLQRVTGGWERGMQISLFLKSTLPEQSAVRLADKIRQIPGVQKVEYISRAAALAEFKRLSGFGEALDSLETNPLPPVLIVQPAVYSDTNKLHTLVQRLRQEAGVEMAQLDMEWVQRLQAILGIAERGVWILATLLAAGVVLIVGNTIRLAILNRRTEIEIVTLIGGTPAFIRRPFLYSGLLQGLFGAIIAWLLVNLSLGLLSNPIQHLSNLYNSQFRLEGLKSAAVFALLIGGALFGWLGSRLAVARHLREIHADQ